MKNKNMRYSLIKETEKTKKDKGVLIASYQRLFPLMTKEKKSVTISMIATLINAITSLLIPFIIAHIVDTYIANKNFYGIISISILLLIIIVFGFISNYIQIINMGGVGRRLLFNLRNKIFDKLQDLPVAFFNQNKAGDLISRINNDTDKLNQFFSQALMQFIGSIFIVISTGIFILFINLKLGVVALLPAFLALIITQILSPWVKRANLKSLDSLGSMSAEIKESIENFKVIVAFNRIDYLKDKFSKVNEKNYSASVSSGIANNIFNPIYVFASSSAQLSVLAYGIYLISTENFSIGLLIGFLLYVNNFYNPLRQLASVWSSLQLALAALDRISEVLKLESNLKIKPNKEIKKIVSSDIIMEFKNVSFNYQGDKDVLRDINFKLRKGKTYALVGPTGGGKTTTASLMARLYDPTKGSVYLDGKNIQCYKPAEKVKKIGFILQEPFLFNGTIRENILYGNIAYSKYTNAELTNVLKERNLAKLVSKFSDGLNTKVFSNGDSISLGQKQLIAFIRVVLRDPDMLILDEATANIDTVTEQLLEKIINQLPKKTTKVIIAHRLNTIEHADEIFFINSSKITQAGSMQDAVDMLLHNKRNS